MTRYALVPVIFLAFVAVSYGQVPQHGHVVIVLEENTGYSSVFGTTAMPYLNSLISQYGLATNYYADTHPSIGNYFMLTTGQIITNNDDYVPPTGGLDVDNVVRQLLPAGKTWKVYAEDLPSVGYTGGDSGLYLKHHNPFVYLSDVVGSSTQLLNVVPFTQFPTDLANNQVPDYSFIVPNRCNDAHDCSLTIADDWLHTNIAPLVSSPTFQQNGLLLILFDEANSSDLTNGGGHIVWTAVGAKVKAAYKSATFFQHESTLRLSMEALGINSGFPGAAASAPQMTEFFTLLDPFFGMHETNAALHGWPPVPFGSFRIWDASPSVTWRDINTASGVYNWTDLDNLVKLAQSHGVDLIYTFGKTPAWASSNPSGSCGNNDAGSCYAPTSQSDWTAFVTAITSRYAGKIKYWELWNEPNASNFWAGTTAELEVMAQNAYPIIKAADVGSVVLSPSAQGTSAYSWMDAYLAAGGGPYADVISFHGYLGLTGGISDPPEGILALVNNMKNVMANRGQSSKQLWDTEQNWGNNSNLPDEDQQAAWLARHLLLSFSSGVARSIWYSWDNPTFGTLWDTTNGPHKPGVAYSQVYSWLLNATLTSACAVSGTIWTCGIREGTGTQALAVWDTAGNSSYTPDAQYLQYRDLAGNITAISAAITIGTKPLLLEAAAGSVPMVFLSPTGLSFGNQLVGTTSPNQTVTLMNTGAGTLSVTSISITGTNAADFSQTTSCGSSLAPGNSCTMDVNFTPSTNGNRKAAITITDDAGNNPQTVSLMGNGTTGGIGAIGFVQALGKGTSAASNTVLINTTVGDDVIVVVAFPSTIPTVTSLSDTGGSTYTLIAAVNNGTSARVEMWAAHRARASTSITVNLSAIVKNRVEVVEYSGVGILGATATKTGSGTILSMALTTQSANGWVVAGFGEKNGSSFLPGVGNLRDSGSFTLTTTVGAAVNDNTAASPSSVTNAVTINTTGPWAAAAVELQASFGPAATPSPASLSFTDQQVGNTSAPKVVTLSNMGTALLNITSIAASGDYAQSNTCGATLAAGANCTINVTFTPTTTGTRTGTITIADDASNSPQTVNLTGNGTGTNSAPTVSAISPSSGTSSGGTAVTVTGTGFTAGATVSLGGTAATNVTVVSSTSLTATTAAHAAGVVNVVVTNSDGQSGTLTGGYTYTPGGIVAISFVQARGNGTNSASNTVLMNTTAGDDVIVVVAFGSTTPRVTSVRDSGGSIYTLIAAANKGTGARVEMWATHRAAASTAVTVNLSALAKNRVEVAEYSGVGTLGLTATKTGSGSSLSIALTTASANSWVVAGFGEKNSASFFPSIGNLRDSGSFTISGATVGAAVNDNTGASPSSVTNAVTTNTTGLWAATALELRP